MEVTRQQLDAVDGAITLLKDLAVRAGRGSNDEKLCNDGAGKLAEVRDAMAPHVCDDDPKTDDCGGDAGAGGGGDAAPTGGDAGAATGDAERAQ